MDLWTWRPSSGMVQYLSICEFCDAWADHKPYIFRVWVDKRNVKRRIKWGKTDELNL